MSDQDATDARGWLREWELVDHAIEVRLVEGFPGSDASEVWEAELVAAAQQIVFEISAWLLSAGAAGVVGATVYDVLKSTVRRIVEEARERSPWPAPEPPGREEAVQRARWHVIHRFELETDKESFDRPSLELVGEEEREDGSRLVRFRDGDRRYEVELLDEWDLVRIGRIGWSE